MRVLSSALSRIGGAILMAGGAAIAAIPGQQLPLSPLKDFGESVTPAYEGWYRMPDGRRALLDFRLRAGRCVRQREHR